MLKVTGKGTATTCDGVTRRDFLEVDALGAVGYSLPQLMAVEKGHHGEDNKNVIMIFYLGAPS